MRVVAALLLLLPWHPTPAIPGPLLDGARRWRGSCRPCSATSACNLPSPLENGLLPAPSLRHVLRPDWLLGVHLLREAEFLVLFQSILQFPLQQLRLYLSDHLPMVGVPSPSS